MSSSRRSEILNILAMAILYTIFPIEKEGNTVINVVSARKAVVPQCLKSVVRVKL